MSMQATISSRLESIWHFLKTAIKTHGLTEPDEIKRWLDSHSNTTTGQVDIAYSKQFALLLDAFIKCAEIKYGELTLPRLGINESKMDAAQRFASAISESPAEPYHRFISDARVTADMYSIMSRTTPKLTSTCRADLHLAHKLDLYSSRAPIPSVSWCMRKETDEELFVWTSSPRFTHVISKNLALFVPWALYECPTPAHLVNGLLNMSGGSTYVLLLWPGELRVDVAIISEFDAETFCLAPKSAFSTISDVVENMNYDNNRTSGVLSLPELTRELMRLSTTWGK